MQRDDLRTSFGLKRDRIWTDKIPNMVRNDYFGTQIRPCSVAETSIYETLHISVIITSKTEDNVY